MPDSCGLFRDLVLLCVFSVPSPGHRAFCASVTPTAAVALAALGLCSSPLHRAAPRQRTEACLHEFEFCWRCAAIPPPLLAAFSPVWPQTDHPTSPCCLGLPRLCCAPPDVLRSQLYICWGFFSQHFGRGCLSLWFLVGRNSFRADSLGKTLLRNRPPSPGFFLPSAFKPPLLYLDGRNYCVYCMPPLGQLGWEKASKSLRKSLI